jgi:hypothetical protein
LLTITEQFLSLPGMFTAERFGKLYEKSLYWIAFRVNPADSELRNAERTLIYSLVDGVAEDQAPAMLETLKPWDPWAFTPEDANTAGLKKELRNECVTRLLPKVERAFVAYLRRPESLRVLSTAEGSPAFRYVLFSSDRPPWAPAVRAALIETLQNAKTDQNAYDKADEFLDLIVQAAGDRSNYIPRKSAMTIVEDREFIVALWQAVTSSHIQFRMLKSYLSKREALIQLGLQEDDLPLSPELAKVKETIGITESESEESEADAGMDFEPSIFDDDESQE